MRTRKKMLTCCMVAFVFVFSWQVCQVQAAPMQKTPELKSHDVSAIMQKRARKITPQQREEAAALAKKEPASSPSSLPKPENDSDKPIKERGQP